MSNDDRQRKIDELAEAEADWFVEIGIDRNKVAVREVLRLKLLHFYSMGAIDTIDNIESRLAKVVSGK